MALYSAKEAKWYRRNVERREHLRRSFPLLPFLFFSFLFLLLLSYDFFQSVFSFIVCRPALHNRDVRSLDSIYINPRRMDFVPRVS